MNQLLIALSPDELAAPLRFRRWRALWNCKCNRQLKQSSVDVTRRTGVTTRLESRCLEWLVVFNLHQFVKYRTFKTRNSVFVSKVLCFSVCEKWPYCITTLTVQLNTLHAWIEVEAPLRGNWQFVDHFRSQWLSLWEFWNLTWKREKGWSAKFCKDTLKAWVLRPICCLIERQSWLCCRPWRLLSLSSDSNTSAALAQFLGWLTPAWADI